MEGPAMSTVPGWLRSAGVRAERELGCSACAGTQGMQGGEGASAQASPSSDKAVARRADAREFFSFFALA
jgi:hypothetical protein